jgi:hypothetical protein
MSTEPLPDCRQRKALIQQLLQRSPIHAPNCHGRLGWNPPKTRAPACRLRAQTVSFAARPVQVGIRPQARMATCSGIVPAGL